MPRSYRFSLLLPVLTFIGCAKQPPAAPPPAAPVLGAPSTTPGSPSAPAPAPKDQPTPEKPEVVQQPSDDPSPNAAEKVAASEKPKKTSAAKPIGPSQVQMNLNLVTDDVIAAMVVHPKRALESPLLTGLREEGAMTDEDFDKGIAIQPIVMQTGLNPKDVEEIVVLIGKPVVNAAARDMGLPVEGEAPAAADKGPQTYKNNLKQVGLAFHNFHDTFNHFPADNGNGDGEHNLGFSWRVLLAPYVDAAPTYNAIDFEQEWDSDDNAQLHEQMPQAYATKGVTDAGQTSLHVITGEGTLFNGDLGASIRDITDGTSYTILAVSAGADTAENWMKPGGLEFDPEDPLKCLGTIEGDDFLVLMADGSVHPMPKDVDPDVFSKLVTARDGNPVDFEHAQQGGAANSAAPFGLVGMKPAAAPVMVLKLASAVDQKQFLAKLPGESETKTEGDQQYFVAEGWAMAFPTENTAIFGGEEAVQTALAASAKKSESAVANQLRAADQPFDMLLAVDLTSQKALREMLPQINPLFGPAANLESLSLTTSSSGKPGDLLLALHGTTTTPEAAQTLAAMVNGVALSQLKTALAMQSDNPDLTDEQRELLSLFEPDLQKLEMTAEGTNLKLEWPIPEGFDQLPKLLAPAIRQAKDAAGQAQKLNNMRMIGLAFHNYHDVFKSFPKAGGPAQESDTNKDGLSWRVHLLPFLDQAPLYNQFHMDEPWDSEHNKTLIEQMPDIFKTDGVEEPGETSIHVFIGEGAPFADDAAPGVRDFTDGTSNTLLCVIAGPDTAEVWTKPGGLEVDADDPFAALGKIGETFQALFADGSVRRIRSTIEPETLLHLIQHQDGQGIGEDLSE